MKPLKRPGRRKVFLGFDSRAAVTFSPTTRTVEGKLLSNLMKRVPKVPPPPPKENQRNQQQQPSEANRRVQFNIEIEVRTLLKGNQQSKSKLLPGNPSKNSRWELQSAAHRYQKEFQGLVEEVNGKRSLCYKIIEDSERPNKIKVLYQQSIHLLEEEIPNQLQRRNKLAPNQQVSLENI